MPEAREIKIYRADLGFDSAGILSPGFVYGKSYTLEILGLSKIEEDSCLIQWHYTSKQKEDSERISRGKKISSFGQSIQFSVNDLAFCGNFIELTVYLLRIKESGKLSENLKRKSDSNKQLKDDRNVDCDDFKDSEKIEKVISIKVWVHHRFRWFDRQQLLVEIQKRKKHPWKIEQHSTSLCGMACLFYFLIQDDPAIYEGLVLHLHQYGYAIHKQYVIKPHASMFEVNPVKNLQYPKGMAYADWIALASIRNMESRMGYRGKNNQTFASISWPLVMIKLGREFLGFNRVEFKAYSLIKSYFRDHFMADRKLEILRDQIDKSYQEGFKILLLIDSGMLYNKSTYNFKDYINYHWVVYEGGLEFLDQLDDTEQDLNRVEKIKFNVYSWGEDPAHSRTSKGISKQAFIKNYYGFVRMK